MSFAKSQLRAAAARTDAAGRLRPSDRARTFAGMSLEAASDHRLVATTSAATENVLASCASCISSSKVIGFVVFVAELN